MPRSPSPDRQAIGPLALTAALVMLIVVGPFWVVRQAQQDSMGASARVNHTHEVDSTVQALLYDLRNRESATVAYSYGHDSPAIRERLVESQREIPVNLARLATLTRDNPDQQLRIGKLGSIIEQRGQVSATILAKPAGEGDPRDIEWLLDRNPLRFIGAEITAGEQALLKARMAESERLARRSSVLTWVAMALQLLMLGTTGLLMGRQWRTRRAAEAAALRSNARAQSVLETVREPMAVVDRGLRVVLHNPAFAEVFAVANGGGGGGTPIGDFGNGTWDAPETRQRLADVLARDRELWDFEITHRGEDGRERTLLVNARRMTLPDRSEEVALVTANDVTTQKAADVQVRDLNRQLQGKVEQVSEVNRELEAFSYSVSHDLRAPLRHIGGFADKLGRHLGERNDDKTLHYLDTITTSARRMSQLIDDLLVYSRLGRSALRLQPVDMQSVVAETRAMLDANSAQDRPGHRVNWKIAPLPILMGDENMLRQVWLNLLSNALKYSAGSEPAVVEVAYARDANGDHRFEVADNGVGFDMAYASKLFGVFQRLHSITEFEGTGIGLASVRRVLARHGGQVHAEAELGKGARFIFTLPASTDATQPDPKA